MQLRLEEAKTRSVIGTFQGNHLQRETMKQSVTDGMVTDTKHFVYGCWEMQ